MYVCRLLIRPGRPKIGLPGDRSRILFVVRIFCAPTLGQDLASNQFREQVPKTLDVFRETWRIRRVSVDAIPFCIRVVVFGYMVEVCWLGHREAGVMRG